jgi:hypothetical protein
MDSTNVLIKSAWFSKINWTQFVSFIAMMLTTFGIDLDAETQAQILAGIIAAQAVVTWFLRTFKTDTVTPAGAVK